MERRDILKSSLFLPIFGNAFSMFDGSVLFGNKNKSKSETKEKVVFSKNKQNTNRVTDPIINGGKTDWSKIFSLLADKAKQSYKDRGIYGVGAVVGGSISFINSYAINKLFRAGFRTNQLYSPEFKVSYNPYLATNLIFGSYGNYATINNQSNFIFWDKEVSFNTDKKIIIDLSNEHKKLLIKYLMNEVIKKQNKHELLKYFVFARYDENSQDNNQWLISYETFKNELSKFSFSYVNSFIKNSSLLYKLKSFFVNNKNVISLYSDVTNQDLELLLLINSLHLLSNKHSKDGCGAISLSKINFQTINGVGLYPFSLPGNMSLKYKNFYDKIHAIWNLPNQTINPFIEDIDTLLKNIENKNIKFLWLFDSKLDDKLIYLIKEAKKYGLFVVSSQSYKTKFDYLFDVILPTATSSEEWYFKENSLRETQIIPQKITPPFQAMSILWQILEFSKLFTIDDVWKISKINDKKILQDVSTNALKLGYFGNDTLFKILFFNKNCKMFNKVNGLNTEAQGKNVVYDSSNLPFLGYDAFIQKYLFEEFRAILSGNGLDLDNFDTYLQSIKKWPVLMGKETLYRYNAKYDFYARKATLEEKYIFYGKNYKKSLPFGNITQITDANKRSFKYKAKIFYI